MESENIIYALTFSKLMDSGWSPGRPVYQTCQINRVAKYNLCTDPAAPTQPHKKTSIKIDNEAKDHFSAADP